MKDFFESVAWLFEELLFVPHQMLSRLELDNWWMASRVNFMFSIGWFCRDDLLG